MPHGPGYDGYVQGRLLLILLYNERELCTKFPVYPGPVAGDENKMEKTPQKRRNGEQRRIYRATLLCVTVPKTGSCRKVPGGSTPAAVQHVGHLTESRQRDPSAVPPDSPGLDSDAAKPVAGSGKSGGDPP